MMRPGIGCSSAQNVVSVRFQSIVGENQMLLPDFSARQKGFVLVAGITTICLHNMRLHLVDVSRSLLLSLTTLSSPGRSEVEIAGKPGPGK